MQDQEFFKDVMARVGCDLRRAEGLTFAVFQELRDRITPREASTDEFKAVSSLLWSHPMADFGTAVA